MNFKFGIVSEAKPGFAKVFFMQDDIVTDWFPLVLPYTMTDKVGYILNVKEHVACLCDERCEEGVILGAIHSNPEPADTGATANKFRQIFQDGGLFEYDKQLHKYNIKNNSVSVKTIITEIIQAVQQIVVLQGNNPDYAKLTQALTDTNNLFQ